MLTHLHTHSYFSLLSGIPSPAQLVNRAAELGMTALALTDHDRLTGAIEFYDACNKARIQPIIGLEIDVNLCDGLNTGLVFLARDLTGWASLCRLSSCLLERENKSEEGITFDQLDKNSNGLICLTGSAHWWEKLSKRDDSFDHIAATEYLSRLKEIFPGNLYIELQAVQNTSSVLTNLAGIAQRMHLPVVGTGSVYYLDPAQEHLQKLVSAIRLNTTLDNIPGNAAAPSGSYFVDPEVMIGRFEHFPAALRTIDEICSRCKLELPLGKHLYPHLDLPGGKTPDEVLNEKAFEGAIRLYGEITPEIRKRLDHELTIIEASGYASLFLIMEEVIQYARQADVPYSSRGSAGSSLTAHCLGITSPDPLRLDLYFERFLNPERLTPPDIDTDLCSRRRDQVIQHVYEHYGVDQVAMVATINCFRPRSALREAAKAHGLSQEEISQLTRLLPGRWGPPRKEGAEDHPAEPNIFENVLERYSGTRYQKIVEDAKVLIGIPDHLSVHPGGVVISPGPLHNIAPTQAAGKGIRIVQFDLEQVERLGLVKMDLLGTRGLSVLGDVVDQMRIANYTNLNRLSFLESIPNIDNTTSELICTGHTVGCFGIESPGMQRTLREIQAETIDDLMVALSLYRPGPMTGGLKDAFVNRHLGKEEVKHLHPALSELLADTYGVILYQEQVLRIAHELAGFSLAEADLLRRAMSHFDPGDRMKTLRDKFVSGAQELHGVPPETGTHIWEMMAAFAGYGFPKAHAASYAQVAWRSAYCKTHYPAEFLAAVLANWGGYYSQDVYLLEARRMGLTVHGPHVNHSQSQFSVVYQEGKPILYMGLDQVRDLTRTTQQRIIQERPFTSLTDFLMRVSPRPKEVDYLIRVGALEGLGTIPALLKQNHIRKDRPAGQMELFSAPEVDNLDEKDWSLEEKAAAQHKLLGIVVNAHPLELIQNQLTQLGVVPIIQAKDQIDKTVRIAGLRQSWRRQRMSKLNQPTGGAIYHTVLDDLSGGIRIMVSEAVYNSHREILSLHDPLIMEGIVHRDKRLGESVLVVHKLFIKDIQINEKQRNRKSFKNSLMTVGKESSYSIPIEEILRISLYALAGRKRSFKKDAQKLTSNLKPFIQITGKENIPGQGKFILTVNHYTRPGFNAWWIALLINAVIEQDIHWIMTSAWNAEGKWYSAVWHSITHWAFAKLANAYNFSTTPPIPAHPEDAAERAESVRKILTLAQDNRLQVIGFAPEGRDFTDSTLGWPPYGTGRFIHYLNKMGYKILPVGLYEDNGQVQLHFGNSYNLGEFHSHPDGEIDPVTFRLVTRRQIDLLLTRTIMRRIAILLPKRLQGEFRSQ